jgi:hypothetical protein
MKNEITREQWNELSEKKQIKFNIPFGGSPDFPYWTDEYEVYPNIGDLIEFLGDEYIFELVNFRVMTRSYDYIRAEKVCDTLWEAVKFKLKTAS